MQRFSRLAVFCVTVLFVGLSTGCASATESAAGVLAAPQAKASATTTPPPIGVLTNLKPSKVKLFDGSDFFDEVAFRVRYKNAKGLEKVILGCALAALTSAQQSQGLMQRKDLAGYDAMIFSFPTDINGGFWMKTVPMDLSIGWFDANGKEVGRADMKREGDCGDQCPVYSPGVSYRTAVEVPKGRLAKLGLVPGAVLSYGGPCRR